MKNIKKFFSRNIFPFFIKILPIQKNLIVFSSFGGRNYSGNPRVISERIHEKNLNYRIIWLIKKEAVITDLPDYIKRIDTDSFLATFYLYTAKYWIDDSRKTIKYVKRKKQLYFQTWHGTPLKKIEFDAKDKLPKRYLAYAKKDSESITYLLSGNRYSSEKYVSAFNIDPSKILEVGTPRNDKLASSKEKVPNLKKKRINILFAPTFRNNIKDNGITQLEWIGVDNLRKFFKEQRQELNFMTKFHPNVHRKLATDSKSIEYMKKHQITLINDGIPLEMLFEEVDVLITDYSSIFFDFALTKKPIILFNYDEKEYSLERGFYIQLSELPILSVQNSYDLVDIFKKQREKLLESSQELLDYIGNYETGASTEKVIELIERDIM
ncbi:MULTISPECIES: CDP-glycerol glycerophosphotransferase family protein [Enterococcus]|uniref:CDP-glycerol:poly(Glycerophosphate) glycerophosphotransferase n=1 Tax=Enterococcus faecium 505 TaxID=1134806 RepID=J6YQX8_ENTFC|nr:MULTISPECIES: CDP-glycerol glycerophosphotransferase family protein [Enterococcus]EJY43164.1 CDP-glycerol:poly(glycerophosphate) glycerophosphotransferase [Enterococcus faecium 505]MCL9990666.1 CDP-glycerol glycerophosphotransferase family protein [Enterococcus lactis]PQF02444.1 teichoic acid biosynthesis protein F [Enterococcus faecium]PQF24723.1 teichoic acid biosynthesis protein F [Enterococcus faecium]PQG58598.1 teichoic acid biosynthesis protein F [Enterococcus faecium]